MNQRLIWNFEFSTPKLLHLPHKIMEPEELRWEIRFFWSEDEIIPLYKIDDALVDISNYQHKQREDVYYLLPESNYNIKARRNKILYKPLLQQTAQAIGYGGKIDLNAINSSDLQKLLSQIQEKGEKVLVKKEAFIYKFATSPSTKLELARLSISNTFYFSLCIEGKSLYWVETIYKHLLDEHVSCDYVSFLKSRVKS